MSSPQAVLLSYTGEPKYYAHYVPDLSIAYLSRVIKDSGYNCKFFDLNPLDSDEKKVLEYVRNTKPDFIGVKLFGNGFRFLLELAKKMKEVSPDSVVVAGGPQVMLYKELIFKITNSVDFLIYGESELAMKEFIEFLKGQRQLRSVRNLIFKEDTEIIRNKLKLIEDLDSLPLPDWSVFSLDKYFPLFMINMKRGCQFQCAFCSHNYFWGREVDDEKLKGADMEQIKKFNCVRKRSWRSVKKEVDNNLFEHNVTMLEIIDSTPDIDLLVDLSDYIIEKNLPINWVSFGRVNYFSEELYKKFSQAGCLALWYGIESGNKRILESMGKDYSREDVKAELALAKKYGVKAICAVIIGFPGEDEKTLTDSLSLMDEVDAYVKVTIPFFLQQGSPIAFNPEKYNVQVKGDWLEDSLKPWREKEPHEISYYEFGGVPSNDWIDKFKKKAGYKDWVDKRNFSETEILVLLANTYGTDALKFGNKINNLIDNKNTTEINSIIQRIRKISKEKVDKVR